MLEAQVFFDEDDRYHGKPVHEYLLHYLLQQKILGASVFAALMGYGEKHHVHKPKRLVASDEGPLVLMFIDDEAKVRAALPHVREVVGQGLIVVSTVEKF